MGRSAPSVGVSGVQVVQARGLYDAVMGLGRDVAYGMAAAVSSPVWGVNLLRTGKWRSDWAGRFGRPEEGEARRFAALSLGVASRKRVLVHAVSVGEVNLVRGLVEELSNDCEVIISATTNTGHARAVQLYAQRHRVVRFPLDFSFAVKRFLDAVGPDAVVLAELEVWPNFVEACEARGVPVCVVNGRLSERSFKGYQRFRRVLSPTFATLSAVAAQSGAIAERFVGVGVPRERVSVLDTMKWDAARIQLPSEVAGARELGEELGVDRARPVVVAGSTAPGEDALLIKSKPTGVQLIIAPRKPEWFEGVMKVCPGAVRRSLNRGGVGGSQTLRPGDRSQRRRDEGQGDGEGDVFLLDTIGELRQAYALADVAVVGRSFTGKLYGSDMMEPIGLGRPTVIGPYYKDFASVMEALVTGGGVIVTEDPMAKVSALLANPAAAAELAAAGQAVIRSRQGSTVKHAAMVRRVLGVTGVPGVPGVGA